MTVVVYPGAIARACSVLDESPLFESMPDGYIRVIIRIIKKINLSRLSAPITASRETLARESRKSLETVHRAVRWLDAHEFIQRDQKARAGLRGSSSPITPTQKFLDALLLTAEHMALQHPDRMRTSQEPLQSSQVLPADHEHQRQSKTVPDATDLLEDRQVQNDAVSDASALPLASCPTQPSAGYPQETAVSCDASISVEDKNNLKGNNPNGCFLKMESTWIPQELVWLVAEQDLRPSAIPWLMNQAAATHQRLSDVVLATSKRLKALDLRGRELAAYLRKVIKSGQDFTNPANELREHHQHEKQQEALMNKAHDLVGRQFVKADGTVRFVVEEAGFVTELRGSIRKVMRFTQGFLDAIESRRLMPARCV